MAGFSSFFTSLLSSSLKSISKSASSASKSVSSSLRSEYYDEEELVQRTRNSGVEEPKTLREIREDKTRASRKQVSGQASDQLRTRVDAAHATIAQTKQGRNVVNYGSKSQLLESKLSKVNEEIRDLGQRSKRGREEARKKGRNEVDTPLSNPPRRSSTKKQKTPAPVLERVGPKQETEREREMKRWRELAQRHLRNEDVTSVTIKGEKLTREEAVYWGWVRERGGKGGGRNGGGGRGMGG